MSNNNSRRQFLKDLNNAMLSTGMMYGLDSMFQILCNQSIAMAADDEYKYRYLHLFSPGGPPRWYFDQPLNPANSGSVFEPGKFSTVLAKAGSASWSASYKGTKIAFGGKDHYLPPVWGLKSATGGAKFADLLKNTIMIRGVNMEINSHPVNRERTIRPFSTTNSISGEIGSRSSLPFASIGHPGNATTAFKAPTALAGLEIPVGNPIPTVTSPFNVKQIVKYNDLDFSVQRAISAIDDYAKENKLPSQGSEISLKNSYAMFDRELDAFAKDYAKILAKYNAIVAKEMKAEFPGLTTDLAGIKADGGVEFKTSASKSLNGKTMKQYWDTALPPSVAPAFAFAEFAFSRNLTSSLTLNLGGAAAVDGTTRLSHDQHDVGQVVSTLFTSLFYRCNLACLSEFKKQMANAGLWDKTLVHYSSEFSRTPQGGKGGSDHGFESGSTTLIGGMITKPGLVGNIYITPPDDMKAGYPGTWGHSAPIDFTKAENRRIINDDVVSTICDILEIKRLGTKGTSFVKAAGGKVELLANFNSSKNIARKA